MLTMMRNMLRSKAAGGLFVLLIVAMAAWGVTDIFAGGSGRNIVAAGDRGFNQAQLDADIERYLRNAQDDRGRTLTKEEALQQGIVDRVYQDKAFETVLTAYADKLGIAATTGAIAETIRTNPTFQDTTGIFDAQRYSQLLDANGFRESDYEANLEASMTIERLQRLPITGLKVPVALARLQAAYTGELRTASWFVLQQSELPDIAEPTDEDLQALYDSRKDVLREPERRGVSMIRLSPEDFTGQAVVSEADISGFYDAYKADRYTGPDSRAFTEFVFGDETVARDALGRIAGGASAEAITTALSTALKSGRREVVTNERLADQVFSPSAQVGSIHGPQPVGGEFVVLRLETITPGASTPLEDVREAIQQELARQQAIGLFYEAVPVFDDLIGTGADLEGIAEELKTPVLSFAPVDTSGMTEDGARYTPLVTAPGVLDSIFDRPEGQTTERFTDDEVTWLARVDKIVPERQPAFEDVKETIAFTWTQQKQSEQLLSVSSQIETAIREGSTLAEQAANYGTVIESLPRPVSRTNTDLQLPRQLINALFAANAPGETFSTPGLPGQTIIMQVTNIDRPASETLDLLAESTAVNIQNNIAEDLFRAYLTSIQDDIDVKTNAAALDAYKSGLVTQQ